MPLPPESWGKVKELFEAALEAPPGSRSGYLEEHCSDQALRAEVERLLAEHDQAGSFLSSPAIGNVLDSELSTASVVGTVVVPAKRKHELSTGEVLAGRFRLVRFIARGGMGEVYEAEDLDLHERVAIKTVLPVIASSPAAIQQFKHEIQLARKVTHSNVCRIFDLVYDPRPSGAVTFLTMELLDGITLAQYIEKTAIVPLDEAIQLTRQMAQGLDAAHRAGIIHQDFKSGNVMLIDSEDKAHRRAVITDFGLAYNARASGRSAGQHGGTPSYMAPEQIQGRPLSVATDIYALGVVLYELVTGRLPYSAGTKEELLVKKVQQPPILPSRYVPELPSRVERTILRCLERDPEKRFKGVMDVISELDPPRSRWPLLAATSALLIVAGSIGGYQWRKAHLRSQDPTVAVVGFRNDTNDPTYDWLGTQLSESLTSDIGGGKGIRAIPPNEVAGVKTELSVGQSQSLEREDLSGVREALGANYLLLGDYAVEKGERGENLNIEIRLQDSRGKTVDSVHKNGKESEYPHLIAEAASEIRNKLGAARLSDAQVDELQSLYPSDPEARHLYFEALDKLRSFDPPSALDLLQKAVDREPHNAAIHSALADAWTQLKHDPEAAQEAKTAADLAQKAALPQEYIVLSQARAGEMNKQWDAAIEDYKSLYRLFPQRLDYGLRLATAQIESAHAADALSTLDRLTKLPSPSGTDPRIEMTRATAYGTLNDFNSELRSAQLALQEARKRNGRMMMARAQLQLCWAHRNLGHVEEALNACNNAQNLFSAFGDNVSAAVALNDVATWLADRGNYLEAKQLYDKVIQVNQAAGAQKDYAGACVNAARVLDRMGKVDDADDYIKRALGAAVPIGDKYDEALARILRGDILSKQGNPSRAEEELKQALSLAREIKDQSTEATALSNLAQQQSETNTERALASYREVLHLRQDKGDQAAVAICLTNMGNVFLRRGRTSEAEESYRKALKIDTELRDKGSIALDWISLAEVDFELGKLSEAQDKLSLAIKESHEHQDNDYEELAASILVRVLVAKKELASADAYVKRIQEIASKDPETEFNSRLSLAWYLSAIGKRDEAVRGLQSLPAEARSAGMNFLSLKARLMLVQLRIGEGSTIQLRKETESIEADAKRAGFDLLVREARRIRLGSIKRHPVT
jgi:serine/threonine protein kinase/tetratricopeptide (TPR) repeat protein